MFDESFPAVTIGDIVRALDWDPIKIKSAREQLIIDVFDWVNRALEHKVRRIVTRNNQPLFGVNFLREFLLRGLPKVKTEFNLAFIAHNLQKIWKLRGTAEC